jgi:hypothetical protein
MRTDADVADDVFLFFFFVLAGLVVLSYRQAHFYAAPRARVPVCRDDVGHVAERVHRVPQLACRVRVSCRHDRDLHLRLVRTGLCPRRRRRGRNDLLLLG